MPSSLIKSGSFHREHAIEDATDLIRVRPAPTAIFAANNILAEATLIALDQQGLRVPRDVSIVAFDDVQWMSMVEPPHHDGAPTRRGHGPQRCRARAASPPRGPSGAAEHGRVRTELVERASVAAPKRTKAEKAATTR